MTMRVGKLLRKLGRHRWLVEKWVEGRRKAKSRYRRFRRVGKVLLGKLLCKLGRHPWLVMKCDPIEGIEGRRKALVVQFRCRRCGATRNTYLE